MADCVSQYEGSYNFDSMCQPMRTRLGTQDLKVTKYMSVQARGDLEGYTYQRPVSRTNLSTQLH